jgi:cell division protein FtsL
MVLTMFIILILLVVATSILFGYWLGKDTDLKDTIEDLKESIREKRRKKNK